MARPKSSTLTISRPLARRARKTLSGLRSRWMMPASCAWASASAMATPMAAARAAGTGPRRGHVRQAVPVEQLHDEEEQPVVGLAEVGDADAVVVIEARGRARLAVEARDRLGVGGQLGAQDLHRHRLVHERVGGAVDGAHAALAEPLDQPIAAAEHATDQADRPSGRSGRRSRGWAQTGRSPRRRGAIRPADRSAPRPRSASCRSGR